MGVLIRNGVRYTGGGSGVVELADLEDVSISTPSNGQALKYNSTTQEWENGDVSAVSSFADLTDTTITNPTNNQVPVYDSTANKWKNKNTSVVLTQTEYDALEEAGTVDPDVDYHISDGLSVQVPIDDNSISTEKVWSSKKISESQAIYSTEERVVGTWIDGKPLYGIVVTGNTGSISTWVTFVTLSSDCIIKIADAYLEDTSGGVIKTGYSKGGVFEQYLVGNVYQLYVGDNSMVNRPAYAIIQYTKTTD